MANEHEAEQRDAAYFRDFVENVTDVIYSTDERGAFTFVNRATADTLKCRERDLLGKPSLEYVAPSHRATVTTFYRDQVRERRAHSFLEFPVVNAIGDTVWLRQSVRTVFDDAGTIVGFQVVAHDITARKTLEQQRERLITELQMALAAIATTSSGIRAGR